MKAKTMSGSDPAKKTVMILANSSGGLYDFRNELVQKLFPDGNNGMSVNATRLVVRACELRIIDIDNLQPDEE